MASLMRHLMTQAIGHRALTGIDRKGSPTYAPARDEAASAIPGRLALAETVMVDEDGKQISNIAKLYTEAAVGTGDLISHGGREWTVIKVVERLNLHGKRDHLEVYMK